MNKLNALVVGALTATAVLLSGAVAPSADAAPIRYKNCAALNKNYRHGVGLPGARDKTRSKPVRNFRANRGLYNANSHLDRDRDGIACEKR